MSVLTKTSREFNQWADEAKNVEEYRKPAGGVTTLADALAQYGEAEVEFEVPSVGGLYREADLWK